MEGDGDALEGGQHGEEVGPEVEEDGLLSWGAESGNPEQEVSGVGDTGVAQQAFEVGLGDGAEVAVEDSEGGEADEQAVPGFGDIGDGEEQDTDEEDESGGFASHGEEGGGGGGCALVDIGWRF